MAETIQDEAVTYLEDSLVPQVVRSIICGLMVERPDDHIAYILEKLQMIQEKGRSSVDWESFVYEIHPYRDPVRLHLVHDFSKYYIEHLQKLEEEEDLRQETRSEPYRPDVFKLTETSEDVDAKPV